jgi:transposase
VKPPLFVRPLSEAERVALRKGLRGADAFTRRRCRMLLLSEQGQRPSQIASSLACSAQAVRNSLRAFAAEGLACLRAKPSRPKTIHCVWPKARDANLCALLRQSPRSLGKPARLWTLQLAAVVCFEKGWTARLLSRETIRLVLQRLGIAWKRAKRWPVGVEPLETIKGRREHNPELRRPCRATTRNR